jgi:hypothetical protein
MFKSILKALFGGSPTRQPTRRYRDSRDYDDFDDDDDDDDIVSFEVRGRRRSTREKDWWAFNFPPNQPEGGPWRIALASVEVAGTQHRHDDVSSYVHEVQATQNQGKLDQFPFSVLLEAEPTNRYDRNAVKVLGKTGVRPGVRLLGYLPRDLAAELAGSELPPIEAVRYFERDYFDDRDNLQTYSELKINLLERKPTRAEIVAEETARLEGMDVGELRIDRRKAPSEYLDIARSLKRAGRAGDAATVLEKLVDAHESGERAPPAAWKDLAVIYRQRKDYPAEVALLERYLSGDVPRGRVGEELRERIAKARELAAKKGD